MNFSDKVKRSRELRGFTQQTLADEINVSKRTIAAYETTGAKPRPATMRKLAVALNVSLDYLTIDEVIDPEYGLEKQGYVDQSRELYGAHTTKEMNALLEQNAALFAGDELPQEAKDDFFAAVMKSYLACKEAAKKIYRRKKS